MPWIERIGYMGLGAIVMVSLAMWARRRQALKDRRRR